MGKCLQCFVTLWNAIVSFMSEKEWEERLVDAQADIFYQEDIFEKLSLLSNVL